MGTAGALAASDDTQAGWPLAGSPPVLNGILFRVRSGVPWRDLPDRYGPGAGVQAVRALATDGTWARIEAAWLVQADGAGELNWDAQIDSSVVRAHQHAAGPAKGAPADPGSRQQALG